jgi:MSHA biogenesis protein MshN
MDIPEMSMINQMLKDLDKRQAVAGEGQALKGVLSSSGRKSSPRPVFIILLLVSIFIVAPLVWNRLHKPKPTPQATVANAEMPSPVPLAATPPAPSNAAAVPPAPTFSPSTKSEATPAKPALPQPEKTPAVGTAEPGIASKAPQKADAELDTQSSKPAAAKAAAHASFNPTSFKVVSPKQRSENLYRQAIASIQQGHGAEAQNALRQAITINAANHDARLLLASLLADANRPAEATTLLQAGLAIAPGHSGFSMALARLQLNADAKDQALATLEQGLPTAGDDPEYHAFLAALLQKKDRHEEATQHYITALRSNPSMPTWLIGAGISLRAINKPADAAEAFQRALDTGELAPEVAQFAQQQLKQMRP